MPLENAHVKQKRYERSQILRWIVADILRRARERQ